MQVKSPHSSTAELLTLRPSGCLSPKQLLLLNGNQKIRFDSQKKEEKHDRGTREASAASDTPQPTNLVGGKQANCVDKHRLRLSRAVAKLWDKPTNSGIRNRTRKHHGRPRFYLLIYFSGSVLLPSWGKTRPPSHHLLAWQRPFLPAGPPCERTPEWALASDQQVVPQL